jgi:hypothetical protein
MVATDDRRYDVYDILDKVTVGWISPPTKPTIKIEDRQAPYEAYSGRGAFNLTNGVILIRKGVEFDRERLTPLHETRVWHCPVVIITESGILLQGIFDQMREVFNRYTNSPWSTSTLGTSTTYDKVELDSASQDERHPHWAMNCTVLLVEHLAAVVIA